MSSYLDKPCRSLDTLAAELGRERDRAYREADYHDRAAHRCRLKAFAVEQQLEGVEEALANRVIAVGFSSPLRLVGDDR